MLQTSIARCAALMICLAPTLGHAAVFVCHGADGRVSTTDHLSADCLQYGGKELNPDGSVKRLILTPSQQDAQIDAARVQIILQQQMRQQQREQQALLTRYPTPASVEQARQGDLQVPQALLDSARKRLKQLQAEQVQLAQEAQFYPKGNYPAGLRARMDMNTTLSRQQQALITTQQQELQRIHAHYAELSKQMRALWAQQRVNQNAIAQP